jgi:poly-gamma-glutamate capsule biosynthesis protein CapA/YwtB (metallophosphatase superfamily)
MCHLETFLAGEGGPYSGYPLWSVIAAAKAARKSGAEIVIASLHWGVE